jgi:hypothetical protein
MVEDVWGSPETKFNVETESYVSDAIKWGEDTILEKQVQKIIEHMQILTSLNHDVVIMKRRKGRQNKNKKEKNEMNNEPWPSGIHVNERVMYFKLLSLCCAGTSIFRISYIWNSLLAIATTRVLLTWSIAYIRSGV